MRRAVAKPEAGGIDLSSSAQTSGFVQLLEHLNVARVMRYVDAFAREARPDRAKAISTKDERRAT